jgi:hypothetical protein
MAYISVDVDIEDYLDECESKYLIRELNKRGFNIPEKDPYKKRNKKRYIFPEFETPEEVISFLKEAVGLKQFHDKKRLINEIEALF